MSLDWKKCIICQESTREALKCPLNSNGSPEDNRQTYLTFFQNVNSIREANALPTELKFGDDVDVDCLCQGSWHKSCNLKFSLSKLKKAQECAGRKRGEDSRADEEGRPASKRRKRQSNSEEQSQCLLCSGGGDSDKLQCLSMLETDKSVRRITLELEDFELLQYTGRISEEELITFEAKYHLKCPISLKNRYRSLCTQKVQCSSDRVDDEKMDESIAFVELVEYIEGCVENGTHLFKLSELSSLYIQRLKDLGIKKTTNKTRSKNSLLEHYNGRTN